MKLAFQALASLLLALLLAYGSAYWALHQRAAGIQNGEWETDIEHGSAQAGLYQRAQTALYRLWGLNATEAVYFLAKTDSEGQLLQPQCHYRIDGSDLDARWWSLTVYGNFHLIANEDGRYSYSQTTVRREPDGHWIIHLAGERQPGNWLPAGKQASELVLNLRAFNPSAALMADLATAPLPKIQRVSCP